MQQPPPHDGPSGHPRPPRKQASAFTIVELLIVIAVIIILLSILVVGLNLARKTAQTANTQALMTSISQGLTRFQGDVGYLPPILNRDHELMEVPDPDAILQDYADDVQEWYSITSIPEYLIGYGSFLVDGYGFDADQSDLQHDAERPATGIRSPGSDGVWGAGTMGPLGDRNLDPPITGRVYGPYIELKNPDLLGVIEPTDDDEFKIRSPGDQQYAQLVEDGQPLVILDYWGEPIRYFRRPYPSGALRQSYRNVDRDGDPSTPDLVPTLSDFIRLRPFDLQGNEVNSSFPDEIGDPSTSFELQTGEFALYSTGPDREESEGLYRNDSPRATEGLNLDGPFNEDNIVEVGP